MKASTSINKKGGPKLKDLRVAMFAEEITQEYLAKRWGVSQNYVGLRINGHYEFNRSEKADLCKILSINTPADFVRFFYPEMVGALQKTDTP